MNVQNIKIERRKSRPLIYTILYNFNVLLIETIKVSFGFLIVKINVLQSKKGWITSFLGCVKLTYFMKFPRNHHIMMFFLEFLIQESIVKVVTVSLLFIISICCSVIIVSISIRDTCIIILCHCNTKIQSGTKCFVSLFFLFQQ
jgi:hypothetical protein